MRFISKIFLSSHFQVHTLVHSRRPIHRIKKSAFSGLFNDSGAEPGRKYSEVNGSSQSPGTTTGSGERLFSNAASFGEAGARLFNRSL